MRTTMRKLRVLGLAAVLALTLIPLSHAATPGGVFVTGHDPDYHAYIGGNAAGASHMIQVAVNYVTWGKANPHILLVTDLRNPGGDQSDSRLGMTAAGYTFDVADYGSGAAGVLDVHTVPFTNYDVVVVASDYGGWLRQDELDVLNARSAQLITYINGGGGVVAFDESGNRGGGDYNGTTDDRYGFLPFLVSGQGLHQYEQNDTLTAVGTAMGLTTNDINGNASHSIFTASGGMDIVDRDGAGNTLSLATRGHLINVNGTCTAEPSVGWRAPLDQAPYAFSVNATLPIRFRWGTCAAFMHDESVIVNVRRADDPTGAITTFVLDGGVTIDDANQTYQASFNPQSYGVGAGTALVVEIYFGDQLVSHVDVTTN